MNINLGILGLIFDFIGALILVLVSLSGLWHRKDYSQKWTKRYWWMGWFISKGPHNMIFPKIRWGIKQGCIPPQNQWNAVGFLYLLIGFLLQIKYYLR